jgi:hypothetical protein
MSIDRDVGERVVLHLLSQVFTFSDRPAVPLESHGDDVVLTLSDTGIGVAPDDLPHPFTSLVTARAAKGKTAKGSDLGPERGRVVTVSLPVERAAASSPTDQPPKRSARGARNP